MSRDLIYAVIGVSLAATGVWALQFSRSSGSRLRAFARAISHVLIVLGLFIIGTVFWWYVSRPIRLYLRAPPFYVTTVTLLVAACWWASRLRPRAHTRIGLVVLLAYPLLLFALVAGAQSLVTDRQKSEARLLITSVLDAEGRMAPELQYIDVEGQSRKLSEFRGKVVLLNFWNTGCGPCIKEMPTLSALQREFKDRGFVLVYLSPESADVVARFFGRRNLEGTKGRFVPACPIPSFYHAGEAWPISYLITRSGVVKRAWLGECPTEMMRNWILTEL